MRALDRPLWWFWQVERRGASSSSAAAPNLDQSAAATNQTPQGMQCPHMLFRFIIERQRIQHLRGSNQSYIPSGEEFPDELIHNLLVRRVAPIDTAAGRLNKLLYDWVGAHADHSDEAKVMMCAAGSCFMNETFLHQANLFLLTKCYAAKGGD